MKAHRGEFANEEADIQADKAISGKDVPTEWHDRTNRAVFTWQEPRWEGCTVRYEDRNSSEKYKSTYMTFNIKSHFLSFKRLNYIKM